MNDQYNLELAHRTKTQKYMCLKDQHQGLRPEGFQCSTHTINWRGVVAESSAKELIGLGIMRKKDLKTISTRVLVGAIYYRRIFQRMTSTRPAMMKEPG